LHGLTATIDERTLIVNAHRDEWRKLSMADREKTLDGIKSYLEKNRLMGAKLLAEDTGALALILYSPGGAQGKVQFTTRIVE
jgi:acyl-CoA reductase-like NAD-dependent aldehyde dehydrogenase